MSYAHQKNKKLNKKYDILILKFKTEDEILVECSEENKEGHLDLVFRLNDLEKRIDTKQQEAYSKNILGTIYDDSALRIYQDDKNNENDLSNEQPIDATSSKKSQNQGWQKLLMRSLALKTHPDRLLNYSDEDVQYYSDVYKRGLAAYNNDDDARLMVSAGEVRLKPKGLSKEHVKILTNKISEIQHQIKKTMNDHGYIWYHLDDMLKESFLTNYIKQLGYNVSPVFVQEAIKKRRPAARKPGTRPLPVQRKKKEIACNFLFCKLKLLYEILDTP